MSQIIDVSPLPQLIWRNYVWNGSIVLKTWHGYQCLQGLNPNITHPIFNGLMDLAINSPDENFPPMPITPSAAQVAAYQRLESRQGEVRESVLSALFKAYPSFSEVAAELGWHHPVTNVNDFKSLIEPQQVFVLKVEKGGLAYTGYSFACAWDSEHGLGCLLLGENVISIGSADVAYAEHNIA